MGLSQPLLKIAKEQGLKPTPSAIRDFLLKLRSQGHNWKNIAIICGVSTKSIRSWRKQLGLGIKDNENID